MTTRPPLPPRMYREDDEGYDVRCGYCGGRFCTAGCAQGVPGWVYVKGTGWYLRDEVPLALEPLVECEGCGGRLGAHADENCPGRGHLRGCRPVPATATCAEQAWACQEGCAEGGEAA